MRLAGFNFTKMKAEKISDSFENLKINTNMLISSVEILNSEIIKEKEEIIIIKFAYGIDYEPKIAKIELEGNILVMADKAKSKEILDSWKNKKLLEEIQIPLFNTIIRKSNIKALQFEDELNIPLHFSLPSLKNQKNKD